MDPFFVPLPGRGPEPGAALPAEVAGGCEAVEVLGAAEVLAALAEAADDEVPAGFFVRTDLIQEGGSTHEKMMRYKHNLVN